MHVWLLGSTRRPAVDRARVRVRVRVRAKAGARARARVRERVEMELGGSGWVRVERGWG